MKDNPTLKKLFAADQAARKSFPKEQSEADAYWFKLVKADEVRRQQIKDLDAQKGILTATDYYRAAAIFQHGQDKEDHQLSRDFAKIAIDLGSEDAKSLYAIATDRLLRTLGKKQKFGTQYEWVVLKEGEKYYDAMLLQPYDQRTTDATRSQYNVSSLAELKKHETKMLRK